MNHVQVLHNSEKVGKGLDAIIVSILNLALRKGIVLLVSFCCLSFCCLSWSLNWIFDFELELYRIFNIDFIHCISIFK